MVNDVLNSQEPLLEILEEQVQLSEEERAAVVRNLEEARQSLREIINLTLSFDDQVENQTRARDMIHRINAVINRYNGIDELDS